jgi:hypothetical protein
MTNRTGLYLVLGDDSPAWTEEEHHPEVLGSVPFTRQRRLVGRVPGYREGASYQTGEEFVELWNDGQQIAGGHDLDELIDYLIHRHRSGTLPAELYASDANPDGLREVDA